MAKLNLKLWKCIGSFIENAPTCNKGIVATIKDKRISHIGSKNYFICHVCSHLNKTWEQQLKEKMAKIILSI